MSDVKIDILDGLLRRNMLNIIGNVLDSLPPPALSNMILTCKSYRELVRNDKKSRLRMVRWWAWLMFDPELQPVSIKDGQMVTSLSASGDSIIFGMLGSNASVLMYDKESRECMAEMVQSHEFPGSISAVDYNSRLVVTSAYEQYQQGVLCHSVYVWMRADKSLACKIQPHLDMIRAVKLTTQYILTAGNDKTIVVTDICDPYSPRLLHRLTDHQELISGLDADSDHFVSVSVDNVLKVWSLKSFKCLQSLDTQSLPLKVAMRWPLAVTGGENTVHLWNIETGSLLSTLSINTKGVLSCLTITRREENMDRSAKSTEKDLSSTVGEGILIAAGDNQGVVAFWDCSILFHGWDRLEDTLAPHRFLQIGNGKNLLSALSLSPTSLVTGDWSGRVLVWKFINDPDKKKAEEKRNQTENLVGQSIQYAV